VAASEAVDHQMPAVVARKGFADQRAGTGQGADAGLQVEPGADVAGQLAVAGGIGDDRLEAS
ncbi:hypothetical protein, partial [Paenirhodobacter populi]|uniref:hypothetical protein n=1 Tax=Paenirhodobacter populi TaxID=2306993 RepID=UPI0019D4859D